MKTALILALGLALGAQPAAAVSGSTPSSARSAGFAALAKAADAARQANHDEQAIQFYRRALALRPQWDEGLWYLGTLQYEKGQYAAARDTLRRFVASQPNAGPAWALVGLSEYQTREYPRALDHLQRAMALGMGGRKDLAQSVFYFVAVLLTRFERYDDSLNLLFKMIGGGQEKLPLIEPIGLAALRMPLLPSEIPADRADLVRMAGEASYQSQTPQHDEADKIFKEMEARYPNEPGVHFLYGVYLMDLRPEDGIRELKEEIAISPSHVPARIRLAAAYLQDQEFDQALPLAQEAVKLDPDYGAAHMMLGEVEVGKGNLADGIKELETARAKQPLIPRVHWDLLRAYTAAGRTEDAAREKTEIEKLSRPASEDSSGHETNN
jgi:tetratricopeptide (TPR) repeat protein